MKRTFKIYRYDPDKDTKPYMQTVEVELDGHERMLLDALVKLKDLFVRSDEQEQAWRWVEPILEAWRHDASGLKAYSAGTWGPAAASALVARDGFAWAEES